MHEDSSLESQPLTEEEVRAFVSRLWTDLDLHLEGPSRSTLMGRRLAMVVIPTVALACIFLALAGTIWWAIRGPGLLRSIFTPQDSGELSVYALILVAGVVISSRLIGGLVARLRFEVDDLVELRAWEHPLLFELLKGLCEAVDARPVHRVGLALGPTVALSSRTWRDAFRGRSTLWLGAPVISGLSVRQLAVLLADELLRERFAGGARAASLAGRSNAWLPPALHEAAETILLAPYRSLQGEVDGFLEKAFGSPQIADAREATESAEAEFERIWSEVPALEESGRLPDDLGVAAGLAAKERRAEQGDRPLSHGPQDPVGSQDANLLIHSFGELSSGLTSAFYRRCGFPGYDELDEFDKDFAEDQGFWEDDCDSSPRDGSTTI